jgi:tRNA 2-thiouridine synthesizing protein A
LVRLIADDPLARIDVPHFLARAGHDLVSLETTALGLEILVRKGAAKPT